MFTHVVLAIQVQKIDIGEPMTANEAHYCMYRARDLYEVLYITVYARVLSYCFFLIQTHPLKSLQQFRFWGGGRRLNDTDSKAVLKCECELFDGGSVQINMYWHDVYLWFCTNIKAFSSTLLYPDLFAQSQTTLGCCLFPLTSISVTVDYFSLLSYH